MPAQIANRRTAALQGCNENVSPPESSGERAGTETFRSILFDDFETDTDIDSLKAPDCFADLHLDQIVESITAGREEYDLKPIFYASLKSVETIHYRHDVFRDLQKPALLESVRAFASEMQRMRIQLAQAKKLYYEIQQRRLFLDAVEIYSNALMKLTEDLAGAKPASLGLRNFLEYLHAYTQSAAFGCLCADTQKLKSDLNGIRYSLHIDGNRIVVHRYELEEDYSAEVLATFAKFSQGASKEYKFGIPFSPEMNHVEAAIASRVERLYPETFAFLNEYCSRYADYLDRVMARFDREVQFYVAVLDLMRGFVEAGLSFCFPQVMTDSKEVEGCEAYDLALANRLLRENIRVVVNDFHLKDGERIFVVSGPNQGGKTTFARTFGQLHYLAGLGCPVPGTKAKLFHCDRICTHFEREEDLQNLSGKLEEELVRIHRILEDATPNSILIMNESFLSTTLEDALFLSRKMLEKIVALDMLCVSVTFLEELASMGNTTVSMVSTVNPEDPAQRTFKVIRRPADGLAYAAAIAEKYHLSQEAIKRRIQRRAKESDVQ